MKKYRDPRINVKSMSVSRFFALYISVLLICGSFSVITLNLMYRNYNAIYIVRLSIAYVVVISLLISLLYIFFRKKYLMFPASHLSEAARKVTQGDFSVRITPIRKDGKKDEFEVLFDDFNIMAEELASIELLKNDFISNVSHEFKTPLSVIRNYATIMQEEELTEGEKRLYTEKVIEATQKLSMLITNILQINKLENYKIRPKQSPFNLSEQLCRCALNFEALWDEKSIELITELDQNLIIYSDEELLDLVWNNLLSNALKFTPSGGKVHITVKQVGSKACVIVEDNGCGIQPQSMDNIFDKFYQEDISHATQGNGLGLALVRRIITILDGSISIDSTPGVGSTFEILIKIE